MAGHSKAYNDRRNAIRKAVNRISGLKEQLAGMVTLEAKRYIQKRINEFTRLIESTRTYSKETGKRIRTSAEVAANVETLNRMNERYNGSLKTAQKKAAKRYKEANAATQIELARASRGESARYSAEQVHLFYKYTVKSWQNVPYELRNQAIMRDLGTASLADAIERVLNNPQNVALNWAITVLNHPEDYSDDDRTRAFDILRDNEDDFTISPSDGPSQNMPAQEYNPLSER